MVLACSIGGEDSTVATRIDSPGAPRPTPSLNSSGPSSSIPSTIPPGGIPTDPRRDMLKELIASQLVTNKADIDATIRAIVTKSDETQTRKSSETKQADTRATQPKAIEARPDRSTSTTNAPAPPPAPAPAPSLAPPSSVDVQKALQNLQKQAGLPITGKFDDATVKLLKDLGLVQQPKPASSPTSSSNGAPPAEPKKPVDAATQAAARARSNNDVAQLKARVLQQATTSLASSRPQPPPAQPDTKIDRALDPSRLLASLIAAGFQGSADKALSSFQTANNLPVTSTLDPKTVETLAQQGHLTPEQAEAHNNKQVPSAGGQGTSTGSSKDAAKTDSTRPQAATQNATKAGDLATRNAASTPEEARERARLESLLAQAAAVERGVQEGQGDPAATAGHGQQPGSTTGLSGSGGTGGGAMKDGEEAAIDVAGDAGDEDSVGNAKAGDDDHDDHRRGNASDVVDEIKEGETPEGYYRVAKLSAQVKLALEDVARIDDGTVPIHYTWDVTLHRPGVYKEGQPAEALWHLLVERAHAFDPVWQQAAHAIASRLLYVEPDADPLTHDEILGALRRARVR